MKNKKTLPLYLVGIVSLLIMHYYILVNCRLEEATDILLWIDNLFGVVFDYTIICAFLCLITGWKVHLSIFITSITAIGWSFTNVLYSRFFHHYLSLSAIGQARTLADSFMLNNIKEGFQYFDFIYILLFVVCIWFFHTSKDEEPCLKWHSLFVIWPLSLLAINLVSHLLFCILTPGLAYPTYYKHRVFVRHVGLLHSSAEPNWASFHRGSIRQLIIPAIWQTFSDKELTSSQRAAIKKEYSNHYGRISQTTKKVKGKNIIFIIVESYLSSTSDLIVDGKEITPFLNSLKHDSTTYYNGQLQPNITIGESSDGQFLYMTGILPLRSEVTVTKAKYTELPGLPKVLKNEGLISETQMIIPTLPSMWEQEDMCKKYGFGHLYTSADYKNGEFWYLSDQQIFKYALEKNISANQPFLSVILTMTMHQPYTSPMDPEFIVRNESLTEKYRNYLSTCHYTDQQIKWYFEQLKKKGLYDNSIIVIVADHHAHASLFDMKEGDISSDIPLYIINGNINKATGWQGRCNQLDVYTTLLDILDTKGDWKGFGYTLITNNYHDSIKPQLWELSEQIVLGNYFKQKE